MARGLRTKLKREELERLYLKERGSLEDIARLYGTTRTAVWKYCKALGISRRNRSEARLEAQKRGKVPQQYFNINEDFFDEWSPEMAYILGLLMTDGCLSRAERGSYRISLCLNDKELLGKVAKIIGSDHSIIPSRYQAGLFIFIFGRDKLTQALFRLGMRPRKSLDLEFPDVPNEYLRDFIRGVFDGDGSVYFNSRSTNYSLVTKFVGGSRNFIYGLEKKLQVLGMPARRIYQEKHKNPSYMFRYGHKDSVKLFSLLYNGVNNRLFLERKYNKFNKGANYGEAR